MPSIILSWAITKIGAEIRVLPYAVSISLPNLLWEVGLQRIQWSYKVAFMSYHRPKNQGTFTSNPSLNTTLTLRILLQSRSYQDQSTQKSCKLEEQYEQIAYLNQKFITKESQKQVPCEGTWSRRIQQQRSTDWPELLQYSTLQLSLSISKQD
jgi:hypothetical protein